ncbi:9966_t:CDS:10 [Paraglomus brasilianum]|uniref:9966_t:CDS:1 n=1 Tax=Paraglomus brasilianum TaxID=144538 RepID=A0A9N9AU14_9GLOM|nr:9966_t:CDS:10 [Paraglomus brasilianum]
MSTPYNGRQRMSFHLDKIDPKLLSESPSSDSFDKNGKVMRMTVLSNSTIVIKFDNVRSVVGDVFEFIVIMSKNDPSKAPSSTNDTSEETSSNNDSLGSVPTSTFSKIMSIWESMNKASEEHVYVLDPPKLETVAELIKTGKVKNIIVMAGAGISTDAGIPDFRSPGTGLYDNLQKYDLPYPEAIFDIEYFRLKPEPFFELARELYPGNYLPTATHYFIKLLHEHQVLLRCFTQNVDTLERLAGVPEDKLVEAHGSFAEAKCLKCKKLADPVWMREVILSGEIPKCPHCQKGIVKPCITFFGESLPDKFFRHLQDFSVCDLLIVIGTSLQVQPFAGLIDNVDSDVPRLLINRDAAGVHGISGYGFDFEGKYKYVRDVFYKGSCDEGVRKLADLCGWKDELETLCVNGHAELKKQYGIPAVIASQLKKEDLGVEILTKEFEKKAVIKDTGKDKEVVIKESTKDVNIITLENSEEGIKIVETRVEERNRTIESLASEAETPGKGIKIVETKVEERNRTIESLASEAETSTDKSADIAKSAD